MLNFVCHATNSWPNDVEDDLFADVDNDLFVYHIFISCFFSFTKFLGSCFLSPSLSPFYSFVSLIQCFKVAFSPIFYVPSEKKFY